MWKLAENSSQEKPMEIDETSSKSVVYVRKGFEKIPAYDNDMNKIGEHWRYLENTIPKSDWEVYKQLIETQSSIAEIEDALCDLSKEA